MGRATEDHRLKHAFLETNWDVICAEMDVEGRIGRMLSVLYLRYHEGYTLQEVGNYYGITRERVRQLENDGLRRAYMAVERTRENEQHQVA